jgi:hypothetical protein
MNGPSEDCATESALAARQAHQVPSCGKRLKPRQKLGDAYLNANLPVMRRRHSKAEENDPKESGPARRYKVVSFRRAIDPTWT